MVLSVLFAILAGPAAQPLSAQERGIEAVERVIQIEEPAAWRGVESRGIEVVARRSVRVVGRATHPSGIDGVIINGDRAALRRQDDGSFRFTGYVNVDERTTEVEIAAFAADGRTFVRTFPLTPNTSEQPFATPEEAWRLDTFRGKRWAVIVGVSEYADPRIRPLQYADRDARAVYDFLVSDAAGLNGFPPENIALLLNRDATHQNLRTALFNFLKEATEDDQIVIYFAGHGAPDPERLNQLYLLTYDTRVDNIAGTAFPMDQVAQATREMLARDIIVIADACHSAGVGGQVALRDVNINQINQTFLEELNASTGGLTIFTASQATQASHEGEQWGGGHGIFTYYMLEGLRGAADEDEDRIVTLVEMMEFTRERVRRETRNSQIPTISQTAFDQALPLAVVLDEEIYAQTQPTAGHEVALPSMFDAPEMPLTITTFDPGSAFIRGIVFPGMGMFYVDRPGAGALYAIATAGITTGLYLALDPVLGNAREQYARDHDCTDVDLSPEWNPGGTPCAFPFHLEHYGETAFGIAALGGIAAWLSGAFHARSIARGTHEEAERLRRTHLELPGDFRIERPALAVAPDGAAQLELVRLRF